MLINHTVNSKPRTRASGSAVLQVALILLGCGFLLSVGSMVIMHQYYRANASEEFSYLVKVHGAPDKSLGYYVFYCGQLFCVGLAGIFGMLAPEAQHVNVRYRRWLLGLAVYIVISFITTLRTFSSADWLSKKVFHPSGFAGGAIVIVTFCAVSGAAWPSIHRLFVLVSAILSGIVTYSVFTDPLAQRWQGSEYLSPYLSPLFWFAAWVMLSGISERSRTWRVYQFLPLTVYLGASVFTQNRSNFLMAAVLTLIWLRRRGSRRRDSRYIQDLSVLTLIGLCSIGLYVWGSIANNGYLEAWQGAYEMLTQRLFADTRSSQYQQFFSQVSPVELLWGRGAMSTYSYFPYDALYSAGLESLYVTLAFFGGFPLLFSHLVVHGLPALREAVSHSQGYPWVCRQIVLLFFLRMLISQAPSLSVDYYPVLLCVGGCLAGLRGPSLSKRTVAGLSNAPIGSLGPAAPIC